jgi:protein SCO1
MALGLWLLLACQSATQPRVLPVLGPMELQTKAEGGIDTVFLPYPWFAFEDQYGALVNPDSLTGQVLVVDFFFSSCPTICKDLRTSLERVYAVFGEDRRVRILSHTVDPEFDTQEVLAEYAQSSGVKNRNWLFLRGPEEEIYQIAKQAYLSYVASDSTAPGGFLHSGHLVLLDADKKIRGVYDGTSAEETDQLLKDLPILLK